MHQKPGIAPAVIAAVVVVVIVVAGIGAYEALSSPSAAAPSSSTSTMPPATTSSTSTSSIAGATSTASTISSSSSSCTANATSVSAAEASVAPLLSAFSAMELQYNVTSNGQSANGTESYTTAYVSATTYKVNLVYAGEGQNVTSTAWILKNGTAVAIDELGENLTGSQSQEAVVSLFAGFSAEVQVGSQLSTYTSSQYFRSTGTTTTTVGADTFTVTNYVANTLPETITLPCGGGTTTLTSFDLSVGEPMGTSYELVTSMQLAESATVGGATTTTSFSIEMLSFTAA